jgi:hypothetical protein
MFTVVLFSGINNCSTVLFSVATERNVFYRERFSRMYNSWAYSLAQVKTFSQSNNKKRKKKKGKKYQRLLLTLRLKFAGVG